MSSFSSMRVFDVVDRGGVEAAPEDGDEGQRVEEDGVAEVALGELGVEQVDELAVARFELVVVGEDLADGVVAEPFEELLGGVGDLHRAGALTPSVGRGGVGYMASCGGSVGNNWVDEGTNPGVW
jgi:hypothetical protein